MLMTISFFKLVITLLQLMPTFMQTQEKHLHGMSRTYLGVAIDNKLNFSVHINITCKKANQRIGVLMRLKNLVPTVAKLHL